MRRGAIPTSAGAPPVDIPAEPRDWLPTSLASFARLGPLCGLQRLQNSRNEPHCGPSR